MQLIGHRDGLRRANATIRRGSHLTLTSAMHAPSAANDNAKAVIHFAAQLAILEDNRLRLLDRLSYRRPPIPVGRRHGCLRSVVEAASCTRQDGTKSEKYEKVDTVIHGIHASKFGAPPAPSRSTFVAP